VASRNNRVPIVWAAAALAALLPAMGRAGPTHADGRSEYLAPRATQAPSVDGVADDSPANEPVTLMPGRLLGLMVAYCDNDGSDLRENFIESESVPHGPKDRGWIDAGPVRDAGAGRLKRRFAT
jgi:hypothetical protein